jgi:hypothetical protein
MTRIPSELLISSARKNSKGRKLRRESGKVTLVTRRRKKEREKGKESASCKKKKMLDACETKRNKSLLLKGQEMKP